MAGEETLKCIDEALHLLPEKMDTCAARVLLLAIGLQESRLTHRQQIGGPAKGLWQFEQLGGVLGVLKHRSTIVYAFRLCHEREVAPFTNDVYEMLAHDDVLAAGFARLLLYTDPHPLPVAGDKQGSWDYYIRTWRPGKPHRHTWDELYDKAMELANVN